MAKNIKAKLKKALESFIHEEEDITLSVRKEETDGILDMAETDGVMEEMLEYINENPNCRFSEIAELLNPGIGEGVDMEELMQ